MVEQKLIITEALKAYGFGAVIEVTNGINRHYGEKAGQAILAKSYLEELVNKSVNIAAGIAYIKSDVQPDYSRRINFFVNVERYNPLRLERILQKTMGTTELTDEEGKLVANVLLRFNKDSPIQEYISGRQEDIKKYAGEMNITTEDYAKRLTKIKGIVMELYTQDLFEDELAEKVILHRHKFRKSKKSSDIDVIVMCEENRFYGALERLNSNTNITTEILTRKTR